MIAQLREFVAEHPLREPPWAHLAMTVEAALDRLVDLGLAEWHEHDTYRLPPLMRLFSAGLAATVPSQRSVLVR